MILELLTLIRRAKRYRRLSELIAQTITDQSQQRVDRTLTEAYEKATAQGATPEDLKKFNQTFIDKINEQLAAENAKRIRQWTEKIIDEEEHFLRGK